MLRKEIKETGENTDNSQDTRRMCNLTNDDESTGIKLKKNP
jgi:hypothetical protein